MKRVITLILVCLISFSLIPLSSVYAAGVKNDGWVIEDENGNVIASAETNPTKEDVDLFWDNDKASAAATNTNEDTNNTTNSKNSASTEINPIQSNTTINPNATSDGEGMVILTLDSPEQLQLDVLIQLYNRNNGKIIDVPCYKSNNWVSKQTVPTGSYMVYNVLVDGDDAKDPQWVYKLGDIIEVVKNNSTHTTIKLISAPGVKIENTEDTTSTIPDGPATDTDITGDNNPEKLSGFAKAWEILKSCFSGFNLFLILGGAIATAVYFIIQKKKKEKED